MARSRETKIELTAYDDLFQTDESREEAKLSKIRDIPISEIDEFPDHPFKVLMDEDMEQLVESIKRTGNHEASLSQYDELKAELENTGVVVLEDKAMQLEYNGDDITLIGLSDPSFTLKGNMFGEVPAMVDTKLRGLIGDKDNYTILLSHRPELFEAYVNCGVDLVLSGHAHGGQFRLPFIGGLVAPNQGLFPKYDAGLYTKGDTNMIVCRGLGNSIIPIRFNNRPEIVLLELIAE